VLRVRIGRITVSSLASKMRESVSNRNPSDRRPVDLVHLAKQTLGDRALEVEILILFEQTARGFLHKLQASENDKEIILFLHSLKGASAGVGANCIAEVSRVAEVQFREEGAISTEMMSDIEFAVEEASAFIADLLRD